MTNTEGFIVVFLFFATSMMAFTLGKAIERAEQDLKQLRKNPPRE